MHSEPEKPNALRLNCTAAIQNHHTWFPQVKHYSPLGCLKWGNYTFRGAFSGGLPPRPPWVPQGGLSSTGPSAARSRSLYPLGSSGGLPLLSTRLPLAPSATHQAPASHSALLRCLALRSTSACTLAVLLLLPTPSLATLAALASLCLLAWLRCLSLHVFLGFLPAAGRSRRVRFCKPLAKCQALSFNQNMNNIALPGNMRSPTFGHDYYTSKGIMDLPRHNVDHEGRLPVVHSRGCLPGCYTVCLL